VSSNPTPPARCGEAGFELPRELGPTPARMDRHRSWSALWSGTIKEHRDENDFGSCSGDAALCHRAESRRSGLAASRTHGRPSSTAYTASSPSTTSTGLCAWSADSRRVSPVSAPSGQRTAASTCACGRSSGSPYVTTPANPSITGAVKQYLLTPVGDVEGVELQDGTDVRFPPHMGAALATIVRPGDRVSVMGFVAPQTPYGRAVKALTVTNLATNQSVVDQPPTVPPCPPWLRGASMREMTVSGTLDHYILNDRGDIDGLILSSGYEVKFPPHIGMAVAMALAQQPSATIQAGGYGTSNAFGTVVDAMTGSLRWAVNQWR
jgi:hypothetical protein